MQTCISSNIYYSFVFQKMKIQNQNNIMHPLFSLLLHPSCLKITFATCLALSFRESSPPCFCIQVFSVGSKVHPLLSLLLHPSCLKTTFATCLALNFRESSPPCFWIQVFSMGSKVHPLFSLLLHPSCLYTTIATCLALSFQESSPPCFCIQVFSMGSLKRLEKICNVCEGHLISMNFSPTNCEGYYAYSSRVEGKLCLLIDVSTLSLLRRRHKNPPIHKPRVGLVHDKFCIML
jgi:tryptophan-rich sensory protein